MLKVGLLGVGAIGGAVAAAFDSGRLEAKLVALADQDRAKAAALAAKLKGGAPVVALEELVERADFVVEAASQAAVAELIPQALARSRDTMILSVGALLGRGDWLHAAAQRGCRIYVPCGALCGLDAIRAAAVGRIDTAMLTSRKPLAALKGACYVLDHGIELERLTQDTVIFEGSAEQAARAFPATSNVAASARLALGPDTPLGVRVVAALDARENVHELRVEGEFGRLSVRVENVASPDNPRTSKLAAFSAVAALQNLTRALRLGA